MVSCFCNYLVSCEIPLDHIQTLARSPLFKGGECCIRKLNFGQLCGMNEALAQGISLGSGICEIADSAQILDGYSFLDLC